MPLSTSDSESQAAFWGVKVLLALVAAILLALEVAGRFGVPALSWNMRRFEQEYAGAARMGSNPGVAGGNTLLLGNSLSFSDIDMQVLNRDLPAPEQVRRWAVDDTDFLDWYFGLKRLFRGGAHPKNVVIGTRSNHLLAGQVRDKFFAHYMMDWSDLLDVAARTKANRNGLGSLILARASAFYGNQNELYERGLCLLIPGFPRLGGMLAAHSSAGPAATVSDRLTGRILELRDLCASHGARLVLWIPPTSRPEDLTDEMVECGRKLAVPVLVPAREILWKNSDFLDGFHMTPVASARFTSLFGSELQSILETPPAQQARSN